jgi:aldose sugar dehydrogenase
VHYWVPVSIAPSSLAVKTGPATHGNLDRNLWPIQMLMHLTLADNCVVTEERPLRHQFGRIRDVRLDANGVPHLLTDGGEGALYRVGLPHREARAGGKSRM